MKQQYLKYYDAASPLALFHLAFDMALERSKLRRLSLQNRMRDYSLASADPSLLSLHRTLNGLLYNASIHLDSYDYGEGYFYQGFDAIHVSGLRDTSARVKSMGLHQMVKGMSVLDIGCNAGFLANSLAATALSVTCIDYNPYLVSCAQAVAEFLGHSNVAALPVSFEEFQPEQFDVVLSLANHRTIDENTRHTLGQYFEKCRSHVRPGGFLVFESHAPEHEGTGLSAVCRLIDDLFQIEEHRVLDQGTFLDRGRTQILAKVP